MNLGMIRSQKNSMVKILGLLPLLAMSVAREGLAESKQAERLPLHFFTKWSVTYWDSLLGEVKGIAYVDWDNHSARVVVKDPKTNSEKNLVASDIHINETDDEVVMTLRGEGLSTERVTAEPDHGAKQLVAHELTKVAIEGAFGEEEIPVEAKARADSDVARVSLHRSAFGVLEGDWSYYADPITQRNSRGIGRVGWFRLLNRDEIEKLHNVSGPINGGFVGQQLGREQWWPIPLEVAAVEVVENQLISSDKGPVYPAPTHEKNPYAVYAEDVTTWQGDVAKRRTLFVVGRNFPSPDESYNAWTNADGGKGPHLVARWKDPNLPDDVKQKFEIGWANVLAHSPKDKQSINRDMDAALFEVTLGDLVLAGPKKFSFNGEIKEWLLQYGNNRAEARFVRPLKEVQSDDATSVNEFEASQAFYLPERVAVEVQTRLELPFDHLQVRVGTSASAEARQVLAAKQVRPGLYRTQFFRIGPGSGIPAKEGEELLATVDHRDLLDNRNFQFVGAVSAKGRLLLTPGAREGGKIGGLWKDALFRTAKLAGKQDVSLDALLNTTAEEINDIKVTVGDHAAMLLLREVFVEKMKAQLDWLDGLRSDEDLQKFRDWVEPYLSGDSHAFYAQPEAPYPVVKYPSWLSFIPEKDKNEALKQLSDVNELLEGLLPAIITGVKTTAGLVVLTVDDAVAGGALKKHATRWGRGSTFARIAVTGPDGSPAPFYEAFDRYDSSSTNVFKDEAARRRWQLDATKEAIKKYRDVVDKSKQYAEKIADSDRKELLKLTGISFGAVIYDLLPRLMRLDEVGSPRALLWVPDNTARYAVCNLATTQKAILGQKEVFDVKCQMALRAVTVLLSAPGLAGEGAVAAVVGLAGNTLFWGASSLESILETYKSRQDVQFEFGYATVLGSERLAQAEAKQQEWFSTIASVIAQGAFVALQAKFETLPKVEKEMAAFRGRKICDAKQMRGDLEWFRGLSKDEAGDVMAYLEGGDLRNYKGLPESLSDAAKLYKAKCAANEARDLIEPKKLPVVKEPKTKPGFHEAHTQPITEAPPEQPQAKPGFHEGHTQPITEAPPEQPKSEPGFHEGRTEPIAEGPAEEPKAKSEEAKAQSEEPVKTAATNAPLPPSESLAKADLPDVGKPATGSWYCARENGNEVHYLLGKKLGEGGSSDVFLIEDVKGRDKAFLKDGAVIKIIRGDSLMGDPDVQIKRMWAISERLKRTRIKFAEILEAHSEAERPYLIQKQVKFDKDRMMIDVGELANIRSPFGYVIKDYQELVKLFPEAQQEAVLKLYRHLADEGLVATDISLTNIYLERAGNGWEAAILDIDFIVDWKETLNAGQEVNKKTVSWVQKIVANPAERIRIDEFTEPLRHGITSVLVDGRKIQTAHDFMEKMLEFHYAGTGKDGWIEFDEMTKQFKARLINPDLIEKHFPNFRKDLSPPPAAAPAPPVKKGGASMAPIRMRWNRPELALPPLDWMPSFALAA